MANLVGDSNNPNVAAVSGIHTAGAAAIIGQSNDGRGVLGVSESGQGIWGASVSSYGVAGESQKGAGVRGTSTEGRGTEGVSTEAEGVVGFSTNSTGVWGQADGAGNGLQGTSKSGIGVFGKGGLLAGFFEGDVEVTGDIRLKNADCAEDFDVICIEQVEPGTVMVIDSERALRPSDQAYDKRVAGVISGAGDYKPGLILDKQASSNNRMPISLMGKVYCKVDASYGAIEVGDLLTTSSTPGHAMKTDDPLKAFGAVIGKALRSLKEGQGLIPILIALQ